MDILGPSLQRSAEVEAVLRTLPAWFGIEDALRMYAADSATRPTFAAQLGGEIIGFVTLTRHFPQAWEVHCMAVAAARRHQGIGSRLLRHAEQYVRTEGGRFLQVKTVAEADPDAGYAQTRRFYEAMGFVPVEVFPTLWDAQNPALQLMKTLGADMHGHGAHDGACIDAAIPDACHALPRQAA
jgi:GNAT superfamily N-acetyltransferase